MSDEQVAALTAEIAVDGVPQVYWFYKMAHGSPNNIDQIKPSGINGGLVTQRGASGYAILADDEAMVLTMAPSDAAYYSVVAYNNNKLHLKGQMQLIIVSSPTTIGL